MRWDTRVAIVVGLLCLISAGWYFRVLRPARLHPGIAVDFSEPPSESIPFPAPPTKPPPAEPAQPTRPLVAPPRPEPVIQPPAPEPVEVPEPAPAPPAPQIVEPPPPEPEPAAPQPRYYTVKSGDSLWRIAKEQLGDASRHEELYELNAEILDHNADNLRIGQKLRLPDK